MEAGKEKMGPDWDLWDMCENRLVGPEQPWETERRVCSTEMLCSPSPGKEEAGTKNRTEDTRNTDSEHVLTPPPLPHPNAGFWTNLQVLLLFRTGDILILFFFLNKPSTYIVTQLGSFYPPCKHLLLGQCLHNCYLSLEQNHLIQFLVITPYSKPQSHPGCARLGAEVQTDVTACSVTQLASGSTLSDPRAHVAIKNIP
jgi:hypothetical protein